MSHNPYAAPNSDVSSAHEEQTRLYSPMQAASGTLLGGPVGLIYFLYATFDALGNEQSRKNTIIYGAMLTVALLAILPLLPEWFPSVPFTVAYFITARYIAENYQVSKQGIIDSPKYDFHSNWHVVGYGLLCMLGSTVIFIVPIYLMAEADLLG